MGAYRGLQDRAAQELESLQMSRERRTAVTLDQVVGFLEERFPELADDPDAILAVLHCREERLPASMVPVVRDQLAERRAA